MKKNYLKKLMCAVLTVVCVASTVVPVMADDAMVTVEAATKSVTAAYKYHLEGFDKKGNNLFFSKTAFYKDLNSLPSIKTGKTTINIPEVTGKSLSSKKNEEIYRFFLKYKAPKTGKYVITTTNLQGADDKSVRDLQNVYFDKIIKNGKKYGTESISAYTVGDYDTLYENNYLEKFRTILDAYKVEHPDYEDAIEKTYEDKVSVVNNHSANKFKFTTKLKKDHTYVFVIDNNGSSFPGPPYNDSFYNGSMSCRYGGNYMKAYSFDLDIRFKK